MVTVEDVVAKAELVDVNRRHLGARLDGAGDIAKAVFVGAPPPTDGWSKIRPQVLVAADAADDATGFNRAQAELALRQHASAFGIFVEAAQGCRASGSRVR